MLRDLHSLFLLTVLLHTCCAITKKTEVWQIDVVPEKPGDHHKTAYNAHTGNNVHGAYSNFPSSPNVAKTGYGIDGSSYNWWPATDCAKGSKTDVGIFGPILGLVVGAWIVLPVIAILSLVKVHLISQLLGAGTPTVTTSVNGKEDMVARKIDDAWSKFKDTMLKYAEEDSGKT